MQVLLLRLNSQKDSAVLSCSLRKLLGRLVCAQSALDELKRNMTVGTELKWQWLDDKGDENFLALSFFFNVHFWSISLLLLMTSLCKHGP